MRLIALVFAVQIALLTSSCSKTNNDDNQPYPVTQKESLSSKSPVPPARKVISPPTPAAIPPTPIKSSPSSAGGMVRSPEFVTPSASGKVPAPWPPPKPVDPRSAYVFVKEDLGKAWGIAEKGELDEGYNSRAVLLRGTPPRHDTVVVSWANIYEDEENASAELEKRAKYWTGGDKYDFPRGNPKLGDESFNYEGHAKYEVYFRTGHVLGRITMYHPWRGSTHLALSYAHKLLTKINLKIGKPPPPPQQ